MITLYCFDRAGYYSGTAEVDPFGPQPAGTTTAPPTAPEGQVPLWTGQQWVLVPVPTPASPAPAVPGSVTMRQARLALLAADLLDDVEAAVAAAGRAAQIEWEYAQEVQRGHPLIAAVQQAQGLSDAQIDALFVAAAGM